MVQTSNPVPQNNLSRRSAKLSLNNVGTPGQRRRIFIAYYFEYSISGVALQDDAAGGGPRGPERCKGRHADKCYQGESGWGNAAADF